MIHDVAYPFVWLRFSVFMFLYLFFLVSYCFFAALVSSREELGHVGIGHQYEGCNLDVDNPVGHGFFISK